MPIFSMPRQLRLKPPSRIDLRSVYDIQKPWNIVMRKHLCFLTLLILSCRWSAIDVFAQEGCPVPPFALPADSPNIFSEQQENDLGDALAEQVQSTFQVIDNDTTANLRKIGQRLLAQLPASSIRYQFYLVDYPEVNALSFPGGRVYVTRKMISACQSEDELAGVLAHEIGHIVTRQSAINLTRGFRKTLGISSVGDRKDVFKKLNQYLDNIARNFGVQKEISRNEEKEQIIADRVSIYLIKRSGYSPQAFSQLWDRIAEVHGKTGSVLGDLFGHTKPEQKRLREMQRLSEQLPEACAGPRPEISKQQFDEWKSAVIAYSGLGNRESLPAAEWKRTLNPGLRGNITNMRFSRDGKYLLAQDSSSIFVLSREPFKLLFRIEAKEALPAQFTPDSQSIVFNTPELRVETWSIPEEQRTGLQEMAVSNECINSKLSPDAKHLACLDIEFKLNMFNVSDGSRIFQKNPRYNPIASVLGIPSYLFTVYFAALTQQTGQMQFSPDGRYFVGTDLTGELQAAYDFVEDIFLKLPDTITSRLNKSFAFTSSDRFVGVAGKLGEKSAVVRFPSGEELKTMQVGLSRVYPATNSDYIILRPIEKYPMGVMDLTQNKIFFASKQDSTDFYGQTFASERVDGTLFLYQIKAGKEELLGKADLPQSPLPSTRAISLSADRNWLAVSERSRGAIWNLHNGERVFLNRNFQGAQFTPDNILLADFPKSRDEERVIVRINPANSNFDTSVRPGDRVVAQEGLYLVDRRKNPEKPKSLELTQLAVSSAETGKELWVRDCTKGLPWVNFNSEDDKAILLWRASSEFVKDESKSNPQLKKKLESAKEQVGDYYIHVVQASSGKLINTAYIETGRGSFRLRWAEAAGDYLALYDSQNRLLIYSISGGNRLGEIFGINGSLSPANQLLAAENKLGVLTIYSLPSMEERGKLVFEHPLVYVKFSRDGKQLFVLTDDQSVYLFNADAIASQPVRQN
jgi:WD40 repeat protein